jgi:hypothetical protein
MEDGTDGAEPAPVVREVDFGTARLLPDLDAEHAWLLTVDGAAQSYVDLADPGHLEFEYARRIGYAVEAGFAAGPLDAVHLGGGAMALPRWLAWARPGSRQHVVEADRRLAALVAEVLPLDDPAVAVHTADARAWTAAAPPARADLVVADVFGGSRVPAALTSVEFVRDALRLLRPGGLYVANLADAAPFTFLRPQVATVRAALAASRAAEGEAEVCVLAEPGVLRGRGYGNAVIVAGHRALPVRALARRCAGDAFPARVVYGAELRDLVGDARPVDDTSAADSPPPPPGAFTLG